MVNDVDGEYVFDNIEFDKERNDAQIIIAIAAIFMAIVCFSHSRDWGYCLDDEPTTLHYDLPILPPGTMYDAEHQCRLQYGTDNATVCTNEQVGCSCSSRFI